MAVTRPSLTSGDRFAGLPVPEGRREREETKRLGSLKWDSEKLKPMTFARARKWEVIKKRRKISHQKSIEKGGGA
jgi:hypothetical protein